MGSRTGRQVEIHLIGHAGTSSSTSTSGTRRGRVGSGIRPSEGRGRVGP